MYNEIQKLSPVVIVTQSHSHSQKAIQQGIRHRVYDTDLLYNDLQEGSWLVRPVRAWCSSGAAMLSIIAGLLRS
jgi:hypothetical protein